MKKEKYKEDLINGRFKVTVIRIDYGNIGGVLHGQGNYNQALDYHKKALTIHQELNDRIGMAEVYNNIGIVYSMKTRKAATIESYSKGVEILQELEEKTGYHHPLSDVIQGYISELRKRRHEERTRGNDYDYDYDYGNHHPLK